MLRLPIRFILTMLVPFVLVGAGTIGYHLLERTCRYFNLCT